MGAHGINQLYAADHQYHIEYSVLDHKTHFPGRKSGWGKLKLIHARLQTLGPQQCRYGVLLDTDAYVRTSEPLAGIAQHYGLDRSKLILFSQELQTEARPRKAFINGGFFIVRNSREGLALLQDWYNVPDQYSEMARFKREDPQGLNTCWDEKIHPRNVDKVVLAPSALFTAPLGTVIRHNWFKDLQFEQEMQDILVQRLLVKHGCLMCRRLWDAEPPKMMNGK